MRRLHATVVPSGEMFLATCLENDVEAEGSTAEAALVALRAAVREDTAPEGMVLPSEPDLTPIELIVVPSESAEHEVEPSGPGDP